MGGDIHCYVEVMKDGQWRKNYMEPFSWRCYSMFGFLADVRNYSAVPPIAERRGTPDDMSSEVAEEWEAWQPDGYDASWLSLAELLAFDYDQKFEDRRVMKQVGPNAWDGGHTADVGDGEMTTYRNFLGSAFFKDLDALQQCGKPDDVRIVFWFDC